MEKIMLNGIICRNCRKNNKWKGIGSYHMNGYWVEVFKNDDKTYSIHMGDENTPDRFNILKISYCPWCGKKYGEEDEVAFAIPAED